MGRDRGREGGEESGRERQRAQQRVFRTAVGWGSLSGRDNRVEVRLVGGRERKIEAAQHGDALEDRGQ